MLPVVAATVAGWLLLFVVLLVVPPWPRGRRPPAGLYPGDEPPAVVALLAGRRSPAGFTATLADLADRGWFQVSGLTPPVAVPADGWAPAGPAMCVIAAEPPDDPLTAFELRVAAHVARRADARGRVPAPALSDGFEGGTTAFMKAFGEEVDEEARRRGLIRSRLSSARIGLLGVLLLIPAGTLLAVIEASRHHDALLYLGLGYLILAGLTVRIGHGRRRSAAGRAALKRWRAAAAAPGGDARLLACAAALGTGPAVIATFASGEANLVWSSYRGSWQQLALEGSTWSWWPTDIVVRLAHRTISPRFAEFDGQVIRQTVIAGGEDSPDEFYVVIDDGVRPTAWNLKLDGGTYGLLTVGTHVHARVNLDDRRQVTVRPAVRMD